MIETIQGIIDLNSTLPIQIINFLILVALLRAVAYKPVVRMMEERKAKIAESIEKRMQLRPRQHWTSTRRSLPRRA